VRAALAGLALLLLGAARIRVTGLAVRRLVFAPGAKPRCGGGPYFSISHSPGRVVCAISETVDPGVDVESVAAAESAAKLDKIRKWTATEAVLKAAGLGLRDAARVSLAANLGAGAVGEGRYFLHPLELPGCVGHIAARVPLVPAPAVECDLAGAAVSAALERSLRLAPQFQ